MLLKRIEINLVIGSQINDAISLDWGAIFDQCGVPYVVLHREGFMGSKYEVEHLSRFGLEGRRFEGSLLMVQTEVMRKIFIDSNFVEAEKSVAVGTLRMDRWLVSEGNREDLDLSKQEYFVRGDWVTLFSFGPGTGITMSEYWPDGWKDGHYLSELTIDTHIAVALFAQENKNIPVMIKPKWEKRWTENIMWAFQNAGIDVSKIPNLTICGDIDAQEQIRRSRVILGYGSTTLLEAAIVGRPVIVPSFGEIAEKKTWAHSKTYPDISDCFDEADSKSDLLDLITKRYENPKVSGVMMEKRRVAFEKYVSRVDAKARSKTLQLIRSVLAQGPV